MICKLLLSRERDYWIGDNRSVLPLEALWSATAGDSEWGPFAAEVLVTLLDTGFLAKIGPSVLGADEVRIRALADPTISDDNNVASRSFWEYRDRFTSWSG
jgi:hypothetical protein